MQTYEKGVYPLIAVSILFIATLGIVADGLVHAVQGFLLLQQHPARLLHDFTVSGGTGGALLNAAVMGAIALCMIAVTKTRLSGPTIAAVFTIIGFSLFGKTPLNAIPIMAGVYLASRIAGTSFQSYILMALFGTALGPLVTYLSFEIGFSGIPAALIGAAGGLTAGILLPSVAMAMLRMHEGFNLYNIGLTSGFIGLFAAALLAGVHRDIPTALIWNDLAVIELTLLVPVLSLLFVLWGLLTDGRKVGKNLLAIMKHTGRLPSDFMAMVSPGAALVNAGLLGLAGSAYLLIIGADINGPVIGGLLTIMGFATFGKHPANCWSVALGVLCATLVFGMSPTDPGPVLALLFGTTLAPLAGEFGPVIGFAAGFVHLSLVERTAAWHGGLDLYNNGFAGGLTATLFVAVIQWVRAIRDN
ncbi:MAG: DUF1576 domain-containing protein [Spirochaeta sp.]